MVIKCIAWSSNMPLFLLRFIDELDFGPADKVSSSKASSSLDDITTKSAAFVVLTFLEVNSM